MPGLVPRDQVLQLLSLPRCADARPHGRWASSWRGAAAEVRIPGVLPPQVWGAARRCPIAAHLDSAPLVRMGEIPCRCLHLLLLARWPFSFLLLLLGFRDVLLCASAAVDRWRGSDLGFSAGNGRYRDCHGAPAPVSTAVLVALIQTVRLMVVITTMVVAALFIVGAAVAHPAAGCAPDLASISIVLGLAFVGALSGRYLRFIPSAASLVPLTLGGALQVAGVNLAVPAWLVALAYLAFGAHIGLRMTPDILRAGVPCAAVACRCRIPASMLLCGASGAVLSVIAGVDLMSALLATVPGSIDPIALIAVNAGADMTFVTTLQTLRLFAVSIASAFRGAQHGPHAASLEAG